MNDRDTTQWVIHIQPWSIDILIFNEVVKNTSADLHFRFLFVPAYWCLPDGPSWGWTFHVDKNRCIDKNKCLRIRHAVSYDQSPFTCNRILSFPKLFPVYWVFECASNPCENDCKLATSCNVGGLYQNTGMLCGFIIMFDLVMWSLFLLIRTCWSRCPYTHLPCT